MILFWSLIIPITFIGLFFLATAIRARIRTEDGGFIVACFMMFLIVGLLFLAMLIHYDYSEKNLGTLYPEDVTIVNEEFKTSIKYLDFEQIFDSKPNLPKIQDSCFYLNRTEYFNFFDQSEEIVYELIITDYKPSKPLKINL